MSNIDSATFILSYVFKKSVIVDLMNWLMRELGFLVPYLKKYFRMYKYNVEA